MYDLLLKGGQVIDPANGMHDQKDIGICNGRIAIVASDLNGGAAKKVIDCTGKIVTPGLIDLHAHVSGGIVRGITPDEGGVFSGVTAVCDAGSTGYTNFAPFKKYVISQAKTDTFCFLDMSSTGHAVAPEIWSWRNINPEATARTIAANRDIIKGVKIRVVEDLVTCVGLESIKATKKVAAEFRLPIMIHVGLIKEGKIPEDEMNAFSREMLNLLDKGDVVTHVYTWRSGGVIRPGQGIFPELKDAISRGVVMDIGLAKSNWSVDIARKAIEQGILPTTISTDMTEKGIYVNVFNLLTTMSKFLPLGLTLDQVVEMSAINPARVLGEESRRGSLGVGMAADISVIEPNEGDFTFADGIAGKTFKGKLLLVPALTIKSGVEIATRPLYQDAVPGWTMEART